MRNSAGASKPTFHAPMRLDWSDEKLQSLSQEQLLNLLENLDHQRAIGRVPEGAAATVDQRITSLLTSRNSAKRRKQLAQALVIDVPARDMA
ncbi:MAG: hypothetical protein E6H52_10505 [Betaproteobacteria bacterium]|jgi:hypothetical protein|nr:MAG: hypothetical protein E6H52_10505 [Betaproteobacteria bacterium]